MKTFSPSHRNPTLHSLSPLPSLFSWAHSTLIAVTLSIPPFLPVLLPFIFHWIVLYNCPFQALMTHVQPEFKPNILFSSFIISVSLITINLLHVLLSHYFHVSFESLLSSYFWKLYCIYHKFLSPCSYFRFLKTLLLILKFSPSYFISHFKLQQVGVFSLQIHTEQHTSYQTKGQLKTTNLCQIRKQNVQVQAPGQQWKRTQIFNYMASIKSYCFPSYCSKGGRNEVTVENYHLTSVCFPELGSSVAEHHFT